MAKTINLTYEGTQYTLEFTRKSIETMERNGFAVDDLNTKPMSTLPVLFAGAFLANHRYMKRDVIDKIFTHLTNKQEFFEKLAEMFSEPMEALLDENEGNVQWGAAW